MGNLPRGKEKGKSKSGKRRKSNQTKRRKVPTSRGGKELLEGRFFKRTLILQEGGTSLPKKRRGL